MSLTVTVSRDWLLEKLHENRAKHEAEYNAAHKGWVKAIKKELKKKLALFSDDGLLEDWSPHFKNQEPVNYLDQYDQVIGMLEIAQDTEFSIGPSQYEQWVKDEWNWKQSFVGTNSAYIQGR